MNKNIIPESDYPNELKIISKSEGDKLREQLGLPNTIQLHEHLNHIRNFYPHIALSSIKTERLSVRKVKAEELLQAIKTFRDALFSLDSESKCELIHRLHQSDDIKVPFLYSDHILEDLLTYQKHIQNVVDNIPNDGGGPPRDTKLLFLDQFTLLVMQLYTDITGNPVTIVFNKLKNKYTGKGTEFIPACMHALGFPHSNDEICKSVTKVKPLYKKIINLEIDLSTPPFHNIYSLR